MEKQPVEYIRQSLCCHAPVEDAFTLDALNFAAENSTLSPEDTDKAFVEMFGLMKCMACGARSHDHEVVSSLGDRIWPLEGVPMPPQRKTAAKRKEECDMDPEIHYYKVHFTGRHMKEAVIGSKKW